MYSGHHARPPGWHESCVPDKLGHPPRGWPANHLGWRPDLQQLALVEHRQPVRERLRFGQFVRHQYGRGTTLLDQRDHQLSQVAAEAGVQAGVGLVEQQRVAASQQQPPERDPVRLPARQSGWH